MIPFSKVMKLEDTIDLPGHLERVETVVKTLGGWDPVQHPHRRWEYTMMLYAYDAWYKTSDLLGLRCKIADVGCGIGLSPAIMLDNENEVTMYEPWVYGDESAKALSQARAMVQRFGTYAPRFRMLGRPLCEMTSEDHEAYDIAFCISTLEHIGEYARAWRDLLDMVAPGGLVFITSDFAEDEVDHYRHANLRAGRMFTGKIYDELFRIGQEKGFSLLGGVADWVWSEKCRLVNDYGFASLAMVRG